MTRSAKVGRPPAEEPQEHSGELVKRVEDLTPAELRHIQCNWARSPIACATLGCSPRKLQNLLDQEVIPAASHYVIKGVRYIDPAALEHVKVGEVGSTDQPELAKVIVDGMRVMTAAVSQQHEASERFVSALLGPIERQQEFTLKALTTAYETIEKLHAQIATMREEHENAQSFQNERDVRLTQEVAKQNRIGDAWGMLREYMPRLLDGATGMRKIKKLLVGIDDQKLAKLREFQLIDEEDANLIKAVRVEEQQRLERIKAKVQAGVDTLSNGAIPAPAAEPAPEGAPS